VVAPAAPFNDPTATSTALPTSQYEREVACGAGDRDGVGLVE
jgi:hypothetical protein